MSEVNRLRRVRPGALVAIAASCLTAACASHGATPQPFPMPPSSASKSPPSSRPATAPEPPTAEGALPALVSTALDLRGIPYRNGGSSLEGFDCSGFTQFVYARYGILLPREVRDQYAAGRPVARDEISAGDLIFFSTTVAGASHVGIAVGNDQFVHAPSSRGVVRVERLSSRYWAARFIGVRRVERN